MELFILYAVLASISLVASLFMTFIHIKLPELIKHPGSLVFMQCIAQMFFDLHWYTNLLSVTEIFGAPYCELIGGFNVFIYFLSWNYSACLSLEILYKLRSQIPPSYRMRLILYHMLSFLISVLMMVTIATISGFGRSKIGTCFIRSDSMAQYSQFVPLLIHTPIMWAALIRTCQKLKRSYTRILINYSLVVCSLTVTLSIATIFVLLAFILNIDDLAIVAGVLGSSSGFIIAIARLWNKKLIQEVKDLLRFRRESIDSKEILINLEDRAGNFLADIFMNSSQKSCCEILSLLVLRFSSTTEFDLHTSDIQSQSPSKEAVSAKFKFTFTQHREAAQINDISLIEAVHSKSLALQEFAPQVFAGIRNELTYYPEVLLQSLSLRDNFMSEITFTSDNALVLKKVSKNHCKFFVKNILEAYADRILLNPHSRLQRVLGLFMILPSKQYFSLMESTSPFNVDFRYFGAKNSYSEESHSSSGIYGLDLEYHLKQNLFNCFQMDMEFLKEFGIINYNIVLGVHGYNHVDSRYVVKDENGQVFTLAIANFFQSCRDSRHFRETSESYYLKQLEYLKRLLNM